MLTRCIRTTILWCSAVLLVVGCQTVQVTHSGEHSAPQSDTVKNADAIENAYSKVTQRLFDDSLDAIRNQKFQDAERLLTKLTGLHAELSSPWANLGIVYLHLHKRDQAHAAFERAVQNNPANCVALNQLGIMASEAGQFREAEARYLACIDKSPQFREAHLNLGILYELYLGKYEAALSAYSAYQALLDEPDPRIAGWVIDLERRQASLIASAKD